jgi:hypothetical protein
LQIAQANERAANAENETAKLAKRFANRNLAKAQLNALADTLRSFAGQEFRIVTYWDLNEPATITEQIKSGLETAGWKFVPPQQYEFLVGGVSGVQIYVDPATDRQIKSAASELARVLNGDGIVAVVRNENSISVDRVIHLNVGTKE